MTWKRKPMKQARYHVAGIERQQARLVAIFGPEEAPPRHGKVSIEECYSCGEHRPMTFPDNYHTWIDAGEEKREGLFCNQCIDEARRDK